MKRWRDVLKSNMLRGWVFMKILMQFAKRLLSTLEISIENSDIKIWI